MPNQFGWQPEIFGPRRKSFPCGLGGIPDFNIDLPSWIAAYCGELSFATEPPNAAMGLGLCKKRS